MKTNSIILQGITIDELLEKLKDQNIIFIKSILEEHFKKQDDTLLTRQETADYLKINLSTLWQWQKKGKLPAYSIGNRIYFRKSLIDQSLLKIN
ncbi:MAG: helix-turn-helix domain-containing protein [Lutibacter sp.]